VRRGLLASACLIALAVSAYADPVLDRVESEIVKGRRLSVRVEVTTDGPGEVALEGQVNGVPVRLVKRVRKGGSRTVRFRLRPRKAGIRRPDEDIVFDLRAVVREQDGGSTGVDVNARMPVPVILLGGLGNELTDGAAPVSTMDAFAALLQAERGGAYTTEGKRANLITHPYPSLEQSLPELAKGLHKRVKQVLRRSPFSRVDLVGYSMGGLVARAWLDGRGRGRARRVVFVGTPNEGTPIAYLANEIPATTLLGLLGGDLGGSLGGFVDTLVSEDARETVRVFYPAYDWVDGLFGGGSNPAAGLAPLVAMNREPPDPEVEFHGIGYSEVAGEVQGLPLGTLETLDPLALAGLLAGGATPDLGALLDGEGDLVVPLRSVFMSDVPAWAAVLTTHDAGAGTHFTLLADPFVVQTVGQILAD
jgi:pimeloyl-ACP methyl ester carboxylesterase